MLYNVDNAAFIDVRRWVGLVTTDHRLLLAVEELAARTGVLQHLVAQVFKDRLEFVPLEIRRRGSCAEPLKGFLMFGH